jgi:hypothetical protein
MSQTQDHGSQAHRAIGVTLALGAVLGAAAGAGVGTLLGDPASWTGLGIPIGISIALAVGSLLSRPTRVARSTSWMMEDDAIPTEVPPQAQSTPQPRPHRSTTEAA